MSKRTGNTPVQQMDPLRFAVRDALSLGGAGTALLLSLRALQHASKPAEQQRYLALSLITGAELAGMVWWHLHAMHQQRERTFQLRDVHVVAR